MRPTVKLILLLVILLLVKRNIVFSQCYDISHFLPSNKYYLAQKVKKVTFLDKPNEWTIIHHYDNKGRMEKLIEDEEADKGTHYTYSTDNGREFCKVFVDNRPDDFENYVLEYDDKNRLSVLYRVTMSPSYFPEDTGLTQGSVIGDSVRVFRLVLSYQGKGCTVNFADAASSLDPKSVLRNLQKLSYRTAYAETVRIDSTTDHNFITTFDDQNNVVRADSIYYQNGREVETISYAGTLSMNGGKVRNFSHRKKYIRVSEGYRLAYTQTYLDEKGKLNVVKSEAMVVENEKGLETEYYNLDSKGRKTLQTTTRYIYH